MAETRDSYFPAIAALAISVALSLILLFVPGLNVAVRDWTFHVFFAALIFLSGAICFYLFVKTYYIKQNIELLAISMGLLGFTWLYALHSYLTPEFLIKSTNNAFLLTESLAVFWLGAFFAIAHTKTDRHQQHEIFQKRQAFLLGAASVLAVLSWFLLSFLQLPLGLGPFPHGLLTIFGILAAALLVFSAVKFARHAIVYERHAEMLICIGALALAESALLHIFSAEWQVSWHYAHLLILAGILLQLKGVLSKEFV